MIKFGMIPIRRHKESFDFMFWSSGCIVQVLESFDMAAYCVCVQLLNNILGGTIIYFIRGRSPPRHNEIKAEQVGFGNLVHTSKEKICFL